MKPVERKIKGLWVIEDSPEWVREIVRAHSSQVCQHDPYYIFSNAYDVMRVLDRKIQRKFNDPG